MSKHIDIAKLGKTYEVKNSGSIITVIEGNYLRMALGVEPYNGSQSLSDYMGRMYDKMGSFADSILDVYWHMCNMSDPNDVQLAIESAVFGGYSYIVLDIENPDLFL
jgi:hypothetical protein